MILHTTLSLLTLIALYVLCRRIETELMEWFDE